MTLPFSPPVEPMLAKLVRDMPDADGLLFEPKWDGFRAIVFRDGDSVHIQSREKRPLERYFPELVEAIATSFPETAIVDGEIVIATASGLDFSALQLRLHPAASRVAKLAAETPASFVAFDLLALGDDDLRGRSTLERRRALEAALVGAKPPIYVTPMTTHRELATDWFHRFEGAGLDGVMVKPADLTYEPGKRSMLKVKHRRTADCVVAGFRWHKNGPGTLVGSLLLGIYDGEGVLHHMGVTSSFKMAERKKLLDELEPLRPDALEDHPWASWANASQDDVSRKPGMTSRWSQGKNLSWEPVRIERVCEVAYDHLQDGRFRHGTTFVRWRPDKSPAACRLAQLEVSPPYELSRIFGAGGEPPPHSDQGS